jgi:hypothetical protein
MDTLKQAVSAAVPRIQQPISPFTVIICTQNTPEKMAQTQFACQQWTQGLSDLGAPTQVIVQQGKSSLAEAYNQAISNVTTPYVVLSHNDAFPAAGFGRTVGKRLLEHMEGKKLDLAGFCGSSKYVGARWQDAACYLYGQVLNAPPKPTPGQPFAAVRWQCPARVVTGIRCLDGYCLVARTSALQANPFDHTLAPYHYYDVDRALDFHAKGLKTAVICDVSILHQSAVGYSDPNWAKTCKPLLDKWAGKADAVLTGVAVAPGSIQSGDPNLILAESERLEGFMPESCIG